MGTRGLFGFLYKGKYYVCYNHMGSAPYDLGADIVSQIQNAIADGTFDNWLCLLMELKIVDESVPPTPAEIKKLKKYADTSVSSQSLNDWYCLLRNCQGSMPTVLESGYLMNHVAKDGSPEFQEYAYILNYDQPDGVPTLDFYEFSDLVDSYKITNLPGWGEPEVELDDDDDDEN